MSDNYPPLVDIKFVQQSINKARVFVLDTSGSMGSVSIIRSIICKIEEIIVTFSFVDVLKKVVISVIQLKELTRRKRRPS